MVLAESYAQLNGPAFVRRGDQKELGLQVFTRPHGC